MSTVNGNAAEYVCLSVYISRHPTAPGHTAPSAQLLWPMGWLSDWLAHLSGIACRTACRIRLLAGTVLDNL